MTFLFFLHSLWFFKGRCCIYFSYDIIIPQCKIISPATYNCYIWSELKWHFLLSWTNHIRRLLSRFHHTGKDLDFYHFSKGKASQHIAATLLCAERDVDQLCWVSVVPYLLTDTCKEMVVLPDCRGNWRTFSIYSLTTHDTRGWCGQHQV